MDTGGAAGIRRGARKLASSGKEARSATFFMPTRDAGGIIGPNVDENLFHRAAGSSAGKPSSLGDTHLGFMALIVASGVVASEHGRSTLRSVSSSITADAEKPALTAERLQQNWRSLEWGAFP